MFNNSSSCLSPTHALNQTDTLPHLSNTLQVHLLAQIMMLLGFQICSYFATVTVPLWVKRASGSKSWVRDTPTVIAFNRAACWLVFWYLLVHTVYIHQQIPKDKPKGSPVKGYNSSVPILLCPTGKASPRLVQPIAHNSDVAQKAVCKELNEMVL